MYKNVFIVKEELNFEGRGRLAKLEELIESVCEGESPIYGLVQTETGVFSWFDNLDDEEMIEEVGELCQYIKISNETNSFYDCMMTEYNEDIHEIVKCNIQDDRIIALVKNKREHLLYICSVFKNIDGLLQKTRGLVDINMAIDICEVNMAV